MDVELFLAISQGTGLALATGVRPFLPPLLAGVLARADLGLDFDSTDYAFLESIPFLVIMFVVTLGAMARPLVVRRIPASAIVAVAVALGALEFGGSLADEGYASGPGLAAGVLCALLGFAAASSFLSGAEARLAQREGGPAGFLPAYADVSALLVAALAVLAPPASYVALGLCAWLLIGRRRRAGRKYEGLRVLR